MKKWQRALAAVLVLALLLGCAPLGGGGVAVAATNDSGIQNKIDQVYAQILKDFPNGVFSANGKDCYSPDPDHKYKSCSNCSLYGIVQNRLKENLSTWQKKSSDGQQCSAFAKYVFVRVFGSCKETKDRFISGPNKASSYNTLQKGDLFYTCDRADVENPGQHHWMIYLSHDSTGVTVLEANGSGNLKIANKKKYYYSENNNINYKYMCVWHSNHWDEVNEKYKGDPPLPGTDTTAPTVSNVKVTDVDPTGFTVSCTATDNVGVSRVQFVAWTDANGQDDLEYKWGSNAACTGTRSGNTWTYRVKTSRHNNERGVYTVSVYAYDAAGNRSKDVRAPATTVRARYTVTYDANGGSGAPAAQIKEEGKTLTLSTATPTRPGYTFVGWQGSAKANNGQWTATKPLQGSTTTGYLYYTYGGEHNGDPTYCFGNRRAGMFEDTAITKESQVKQFYFISTTDRGAEYRPASIKANSIAFTGATATAQLTNTKFFKGGKMYQQSSAVSVTLQPGAGYVVDGNITLKAVWEEAKPTTYTVTYNANGGTAAPGPQTKTQGQALTLSSAKPTRSGYTFLGWATSSSATGAAYQPGSSYTAEGNVTLYAVWKAVPASYTVTYNANGGVGAPAAQTKTQGQALTLSSATPTRGGYTFQGWATSSTATSAAYQPGGSYTAEGNATLYAVWKQNSVEAPIGGGLISVSHIASTPGSDVEMMVSLDENPGIASLGLQVKFDSEVLSLTKFELAENFKDIVGFEDIDDKLGYATLVLRAESNYTGPILKLCFNIASSAQPKTSEVTICNLDVQTESEHEVAFGISAGSVTITGHKPGDVNGDGKVNTADLLRLLKYLNKRPVYVVPGSTDINNDGKENTADLLRLLKYLNHRPVEIY